MTARTTISALTPRKTPPTPIQTKSDRLVRWPRARRYRSPRNSSKGRPRRLIQAPFERRLRPDPRHARWRGCPQRRLAFARACVLLQGGGAPLRGGLRPQLGEQDDVADRGLVGEEHHEPVNPDPLARCGRHPVLEGAHEVAIQPVRLLVAAGALGGLLGEALQLLLGVVQLR